MTVRSNIADLQALKKLAQPGYLYGRLATAAAGEALRLVQMGFRAGTDPDDSPWEPLKSRKGMILIRTARMRNSFTSRATARGFVVGSNVKYVTFHQDGTGGRKQAQTMHRVQPYAYDFLQAGKLGTKRGRFISRQQAKKLKKRYVAVHSFSMTFAAGSGAIPIRRMVPAGGQLTQKWQTAIDTTCNGIMKKATAEAGAR